MILFFAFSVFLVKIFSEGKKALFSQTKVFQSNICFLVENKRQTRKIEVSVFNTGRGHETCIQ